MPAFLFIDMSQNVERIKSRVNSLVEPILEGLGYELVDIEYLSEHGRWVLRLYIDQDPGITLDDCSRVSREIGDLIDIKNIINHEYVLEVSSPGLNRPLKKEKDFSRFLGRKIKVKMKNPVNGRINFSGHLKAFEEGTLYLAVEKEEIALSWQGIERATLVHEFADKSISEAH
ncbi:ribosome maturation factor RimP [Thermodesulfobacteriota bacterium]